MKTCYKNAAGLLLVLGLIIIPQVANSQDTKLSRQERKEVRKAQLAANFYVLDSLLNSKKFVLEAEFLQNKYGERILVVSNINFIKVNGSNGILQTGVSSGLGYNGVGGVTADGTIGRWELQKNNKKQSFNVRFNLISNIGHYDVLLTVTAANNASATISGLGPGQLTWQGHLRAIDNARIFKGSNTLF